MQPGKIEPEDFRRGPLDSGHAAVSPMHGPPNVNPLPPEDRGTLRPLVMPGQPAVSGSGPVVQGLAAHQACVLSSPLPHSGQQT